MDDDTLLSALGSMVRFYSSRAEAHASFYIGSLFGLFTILAIVYSNDGLRIGEKILWSLVFWSLFGMGLYVFMNFCYYATLADIVRDKIVLIIDYHSELEIMKASVSERLGLKLFCDLKFSNFFHSKRFFIFSLGYFSIVLLSYFLCFWLKR